MSFWGFFRGFLGVFWLFFFLPDKHWGFWKESYPGVFWMDNSDTPHCSDFARGAEPWSSTGRAVHCACPSRSSFSLEGMAELVLGRGPGCLWQQEVEGRWKCVSETRGTSVFCCSELLWLRSAQSKGKLKLKMRKWFREIYVVFYQIILNWLFFKS